MAEEKKLGSVKRFGPRYGKRVKSKLAKIEAVQRGKHQCPYCHSFKVKRVDMGIWKCGKCDAKFTGKAYSVKKTIISEEEAEEKKKKKRVRESEESEEDEIITKVPDKKEEVKEEK